MEILSHPSPALKAGTEEFDPTTDKDLGDLVRAMARAMYDAPGVGLAAPQLGILKRVCVYDIDDGLVALCNPRIVSSSEETVAEEEGCLSLPGIGVPIARSVSITCEALDLEGNPVTIEASDLHARVLQHEIDHLDGVLIIDRASPEDRREVLRAYLQTLDRVG
ncbi:MAG: peptide deformylase [Actinomycetota bacterium]|nr:peptide deformylase [Actinomycetota bacterium]